jgi:hypothetical protein
VIETLTEALPVTRWQHASTETILHPQTALPFSLALATRWNPLLGRGECAVGRALLFDGPTPADAHQAASDYLRGLFHSRRALRRLMGAQRV